MPSYNGIFFTDTGQSDRPLVMIHGFCCDHSDWDAIVQTLSPRHRLLSLDLRGHGQSATGEASIDAFADDVADLVEAESLDSAVLIGHSMGCRVALAAAERLRGHLAGLVLVDGSRTTATAADVVALRQKIEATGFPEFANGMFSQMFTGKADQAVVDRVVRRASERDGSWSLDLWQSMCHWDIERMESVFQNTPEPVLAIQTTWFEPGKNRESLAAAQQTPYTQFLEEQFVNPASSVDVIPDTGHFPQFEEPDRLAEMIDAFVRR